MMKARLGHREQIFRDVELIRRDYPLDKERALALGFGLSQLDIGCCEIAISEHLPQLRLVIAVIDSGEQVALFDMTPFLNGFFDDLAENFGTDGNVLVSGDT